MQTPPPAPVRQGFWLVWVAAAVAALAIFGALVWLSDLTATELAGGELREASVAELEEGLGEASRILLASPGFEAAELDAAGQVLRSVWMRASGPNRFVTVEFKSPPESREVEVNAVVRSEDTWLRAEWEDGGPSAWEVFTPEREALPLAVDLEAMAEGAGLAEPGEVEVTLQTTREGGQVWTRVAGTLIERWGVHADGHFSWYRMQRPRSDDESPIHTIELSIVVLSEPPSVAVPSAGTEALLEDFDVPEGFPLSG